MYTKPMLARLVIFAMAVFAIAIAEASANVTLSPLFSNNMVLQRNKPIPVYGTAAAGENVTVTFNGESASAIADSQGSWRVNLPVMGASATSKTMTITGANTITITGVLIGDVWVCSGQSNMEWNLYGCNRQVDIDAANYPGIRQFYVPAIWLDKPSKSLTGSWTVCSPSTAPNFGAVGFYFARKIYQDQAGVIPIGLLQAPRGATAIDPWLAPEGLTDIPALQPLYSQSILPWGPFSLFNGTIYPLAPYAITGAIWYQGESRETTYQNADSYYLKEKALVQGWRRLWGGDDLAFYQVQIANFTDPPTYLTPDTGTSWADTRIQQTNILSIPHTGMAVTIDVGEAADIHPKDKLDVGERLALWALKNEYGRTATVTSGPILKDVTLSGSTIVCSFNYVGSGLMVGSKTPYLPTNEVVGGTLSRFVIAGATGAWYAATATISGNTVVVSSPSVTAPRKVAYACWTNPSGCNLYNKEGLPASPFYVDDVNARYTITASSATGGTVSPSGATTLLKRMTAPYTITPTAGYFIQDVKVDGVSVGAVKAYTFDPLYANHTITATFTSTAPTYTIATTSGAGGAISPAGTSTATQGETKTFSILPNAGCQVATVTMDGVPVGNRTSFTFGDIRGNHTLAATFAAKITASAGYGGYVSPTGVNWVNYGTNKTFTITPNAGYTLTSVLVDGANVGAVTSYTFNNVTAPHTISATFGGGDGSSGSVPRIYDLLFSCRTDTLPASGSAGAWATYLPAGKTLAMIGSPTAETTSRSVKWERNLYADGDGFDFGSYSNPITCLGATIVIAVKPTRNAISTGWISCVDAFYDRLVLGINNSTGNVCVRRNGSLENSATAIPDGQLTVLSLVVQTDGKYKVYANGAKIMDVTTASEMTSLVPGIAGTYANNITIGRNWPDGWTTFNGNIGDVYFYTKALTDSDRLQLEQYLTRKINGCEINSSAGPGGTINPSGNNIVVFGSNKTYTITPSPGYAIADVTIDGYPMGAMSSYTFTNIMVGHDIVATFVPVALASSIADLKAKPAGTAVSLAGPQTVIYAPRSAAGARTTNFFYIGEAQGRAGLKVVDRNTDSLTIGNQLTNLNGYVRKPAGGEVYLELLGDVSGSGNSPIKPIGINNKTIINDPKAQTTLVKVWGTVKSVNGTTSFTINDGYGTDVTVKLNGVEMPFAPSKTAVVTGILTGDKTIQAQEVRLQTKL